MKYIYVTLSFSVFNFLIFFDGKCQVSIFNEYNSKKIAEKINIVKEKLLCNNLDTIYFEKASTCENPFDTSLFKYIPILFCNLTPTKYDSIYVNQPSISEILLFHKKEKKIIGSAQSGKKGELYFSFVKPKKYQLSIPIRYENRLNYISPKYYSTIIKMIGKEDVTLIYMDEIKALCFYTKEGLFKDLIKIKLKYAK